MIRNLFIKNVNDEIADALLVQAAANDMVARLRDQRAKGFSGWHRLNDCEDLKKRLLKNAKDGDFVDVLNLAAMILVHNKLYGDMNEKPR